MHMANRRTPDTKPAQAETRQPTFSLEELNKLIAEATAKAKAELMGEMQAMQAKPANGKAAQVDMQVVRSFKRAGFGVVKPRIDTKTFNIWLAEGKRPLEGSKSVKVGGLRLFHRSQLRELTIEENAALQAEKAERLAAAKQTIDRAVGGKVIPLNGGEASPQ
jgi:hypothetical protein